MELFMLEKTFQVIKSPPMASMLLTQSQGHHNPTSFSCMSQPGLGELKLTLIHSAECKPLLKPQNAILKVSNKNPNSLL